MVVLQSTIQNTECYTLRHAPRKGGSRRRIKLWMTLLKIRRARITGALRKMRLCTNDEHVKYRQFSNECHLACGEW